MKATKTTIKTIAVIVAIAMIAIGIYTITKSGLNFPENGIYTVNNLLDVAMNYGKTVAIATILIVIYFMIRYNKLGVIKMGIISFVWMIAIPAVIISVMATFKLPINRLFFPVTLLGYVVTILILTIQYENKLKTM